MTVVLPLENTEVVPDALPMNLPGLPSLPVLGTVAHNVTALEEKNNNAGLQLRINAMVEQKDWRIMDLGTSLWKCRKCYGQSNG